MISIRDTSLLRFFLYAYVVSVGFTDVLDPPWMGSKIQMPEIVFIPLMAVLVFTRWKYFPSSSLKFGKLETGICAFILTAFLSAMFSGNTRSMFEVIGLIYLSLIFIVFKTSVKIIPEPMKFIQHAFLVCGIVAALSGIIGWVLAEFRIETILAMSADVSYPYLGYIGRATGFMNSPNMLFNLLGVCIIIYLPLFLDLPKKKLTDHLVLYVLIFGAILTFSKSIFLLVICIIYILYQKRKTSFASIKFLKITITSLLFIFWVVGTHVLIRKTNTIDWTQRKEKAYSVSEPFHTAGDYQLYKTNYLINKESAIRAGLRNPIFGVGPGSFNDFVGQLKMEGLYPPYFINFDPHSTYLGAFAEMGIFGLLALMILCYQVFLSLRKTKRNQTVISSFSISLLACLLFMALEAISIDVMNFRHLWILFAMLYMNHKAENLSTFR